MGRIGEEAAGSMAQMGANRERHGLVEDMDRIRKRRAVVWREREQVAQSRGILYMVRVCIYRDNIDAHPLSGVACFDRIESTLLLQRCRR